MVNGSRKRALQKCAVWFYVVVFPASCLDDVYDQKPQEIIRMAWEASVPISMHARQSEFQHIGYLL
jgi:hypothetical protein